MDSPISITGPPRKASVQRVGYGYALPLSDAPPSTWIQIFDQGWKGAPAMKHEPRVDAENSEIVLSINLSDKDAATAALDKVASLVEATNAEHKAREAEAAESAAAQAAAAQAKDAELDAVFAEWWSLRNAD